ncbi:MAG: phosphomethylpyrimidine synthase ThiC [Deltaproteobacteria bacterium]|jgi:phosphomethylpyrimidine synthase|nr:phosphomethylpyrimidine synthase ThiC [Deltaproteobacteria bacterium]
MSIFTYNPVLASLVDASIERLAGEEELSASVIRAAVENGSMVLLGNPAHKNLRPILIGQPARVKVNANIGTSPLSGTLDCEIAKVRAALEAGADTVMDLSTGGDLTAIREDILAACPVPLGTVPVYAVAERYIREGKDPALFTTDELFGEIEKQAGQGVDYMTVHCGITREAAAWAADPKNRVLGIVSRGGAIHARRMREYGEENPLLEQFDRLLAIARQHNVTLSLGDALRPGAGQDAGDAAQWDEVIQLGKLAARALEYGVQCMIEGPGHVPLDQVEAQISCIKRLTRNAPLYVLGPLTTDCSPGYDHIAGAIGGAAAVRAGTDFLCYLTPAEHLTLPDAADVREGVMASRVAAQAGETSSPNPLVRARAKKREQAMSAARKRLDWAAMAQHALDPAVVAKRREPHASEEACAMCGSFCSVKMLRR